MRYCSLALLLLTLVSSCNVTENKQTEGTQHAAATRSGVAQGVEKTPGVVLWQDIPYAQPPVGRLRWRAPRALPASSVTLAPGDGSVACLQQASVTAGVPGEDIQGAEDCLYLDVRAPARRADTPRAVMVWIHGGGNTSGYKGYYDFSTLVQRQDVVVVTLNYRLGPLGWFTHPLVQQAQSGLDRASNFGTLDIIQALNWVGENIHAFGGDPGNITVFGESAGAHNVYALLSSPLAKGLFQRAIVQSGYTSSASLADAFNEGGQNPRIARSGWQLGDALSQHLQAAGKPAPITAESLRAVPGETVLRSYHQLPSTGHIPLTTADHVVIPGVGMLEALAQPENAKLVPVIAGANRDEVTLWLGVHRYFVQASYPFTRLLPPRLQLKDPELYRYWVGVRSQAWKLRGVDEPLAALASAGYTSLYAYRFDWDDQRDSFFADFPRLIGAAHGTEISFITGDFRYGPITDYVYPRSPSRDQMQRTMMATWAEFARRGQPGTVSGVQWPPYSLPARNFIHLDNDARLRLASETGSLNSLLAEVAENQRMNPLQRCLLVWDTLTKVGEPDYSTYSEWNHGECADTDASREQVRINDQLRATYGSETVL